MTTSLLQDIPVILPTQGNQSVKINKTTSMQSGDIPTSDDDDSQDASSPQESQRVERGAGSKLPTQPARPAPGWSEKSSKPVQKRRRVTRACDECRKKKIKCDGKQPCTHCTVYSYACTFDQPSNRRRNPAPAYVEALELRLQKAETILNALLPGFSLDEVDLEAHSIDQIIESSKRTQHGKTAADREPRPDDVDDDEDAQLQTMVEGTGSLDLDDQGHWDYHGTSSGFTFMQNLRAQFGDLSVPDPRVPSSKIWATSHLNESTRAASSPPYELSIPSTADLPEKEEALQLCRNTLDDACALMRFVHKPKFYGQVDRIFETDPENYTNDDMHFLPLLYVVMAVGCLFDQTENTTLDRIGYEGATEQGFQYFQTARNMLDITNTHDLSCLQAVVFMIVFLQSTAKLDTCYSHIGIALRACCRLGLHRNIPNEFDPIEQEERKRIFWLIRQMDAYVGALLGLPEMLSADHVDQPLPLEVDDEFITTQGILPMPPGHFPLVRATNAHASLVSILQKVVKYVYPIRGFEGGKAGEGYSISHLRIREIEKDLQVWMDHLPMELRPSDDAPSELARVQQLLRLSYAHVQMMMYRPFLHYVSRAFATANVDRRSYACAAACVSVARNIVHITVEMKRRGLLIGSYWFVMYTAYFSILSLVYFVLENPQSATGTAIMKDAIQGRDMLASLAKRSLAADRCSHSLAGLFAELPVKLKERQTSSQSMPPSRKRRNVGDGLDMNRGHRSAPLVTEATKHDDPTHSRAHASASLDAEGNLGPQSPIAAPARARDEFRNSLQLPSPQWSSRSASSGGEAKPVDGSQPWSAPIPFGPQSGSSLPDFEGLMYPSTNPFAYGNQPLSILEDSQMMAAEQQQPSFGGEAGGRFPIRAGLPGTEYGGFNDAIHIASSPQYGGAYVPPPPHGSDPVSRGIPAGGQMLGSTAEQGMGDHFHMDEGSWQQIFKGRTGLTAGVNLDELFGADGGWNQGYMDQGYGRAG